MTTKQRKQDSILGALTADAASLGFHWLYDPTRIVTLEPTTPEFRQPRESDYDGGVGYFAAASKVAGDNSHYGAQLKVALDSLFECDGEWDPFHYQSLFCQTFDRGGSFSGYIDKATRLTLDQVKQHLEASEGTATSCCNGADDNQLPAVAKIPVIVGYALDNDDFDKLVEQAIRVTNNNDEAVSYGLFAARVLQQILLGESIPKALHSALEKHHDSESSEKLQEALKADASDPAALGEQFGRACPVPSAIPLATAILKEDWDFKTAIRSNIFAGGDNAGRAIWIGACQAAAHGLGGERGVPYDWLGRLTEVNDLLRKVEVFRVC